MSRALLKTRRWFFSIRDHRFGYEQDRVHIGGKPYLDRFVVHLGGPHIRLHRFWRGDDDRAVHDHPWDFWTFPLTTYVERTETFDRFVKRFRWHFRPAEYRHYVIGPYRRNWWGDCYGPYWMARNDKRPFWTIVLAKQKRNKWGFWPDPQTFIYWRDWI